MRNDRLAYEILSVVAEIPAGKVATYGQIARLIGREKNSRLVAKVLSQAELYGEYPCHRVVNHAGRLAPGMVGTGAAFAGRGRGPEGRHARGYEKIRLGLRMRRKP